MLHLYMTAFFFPGASFAFPIIGSIYGIFFIWNQHRNGRRRFSCMMPVEVYADRNCFFFLSWRIEGFYASRKAKSPRGKVGHLH